MLEKEAHSIIKRILEYNRIKISLHTASIMDKELDSILSALDKYNKENQIIQLIDEDICYSIKQLKLAGILAIKAFREKRNISSKPQIEYMLYLAATTQIKEAIKKTGVKDLTRTCLVIVSINDNHDDLLNNIINETKIMITSRKQSPNIEVIREIYGIESTVPEKDLESIILSKIAVVDTYK